MFDREALQAAIATCGRVIRIVVAKVEGSAPREVGAAMLVWTDGQSGTIGGGALEYQAVLRARAMLCDGSGTALERIALGPGIGQCCGGVVTLLSETYDADSDIAGDIILRPVIGTTRKSLALRRVLAAARTQGQVPAPQLLDGWMLEPVAHPTRQVWIWGAGHVGQALISVLAPLPQFSLTWIDTARERFPREWPEGVEAVWSEAPEILADHAPRAAEHLVLTYSHALDLELCHRILRRGSRALGLIGSATKAVRFQSRLAALGHSPARVGQICCPIGDPGLGKEPQAIAIGVAMQLLKGSGWLNMMGPQDDATQGALASGGAHQGLSRSRRQ